MSSTINAVDCKPWLQFSGHNEIYCGSQGCYAAKDDASGDIGGSQSCPCPNEFTQTAWDNDVSQFRTCTRTSTLPGSLTCGKAVCNADKNIADCAWVIDPIDCPTGYKFVGMEKSSHTLFGLDCMLRTCKRSQNSL